MFVEMFCIHCSEYFKEFKLDLVDGLVSPKSPISSSIEMLEKTGDIGVLPPLGVYDPLGLIETRDMRRYEIMEIKHGTSLSNWHLKFLTHRQTLRFEIT